MFARIQAYAQAEVSQVGQRRRVIVDQIDAVLYAASSLSGSAASQFRPRREV